MSTAGDRHHRATYQVPAGTRHLVAQRIDGRVALVDEPADHDDHVYLVERHVRSLEELDSLCAAYAEHSTTAGKPGILAHRELLNRMCEADR